MIQAHAHHSLINLLVDEEAKLSSEHLANLLFTQDSSGIIFMCAHCGTQPNNFWILWQAHQQLDKH
jgi:hypothetical protein